MNFKKLISAVPCWAALIFCDATMAARQAKYIGDITIGQQFKIHSTTTAQNYNLHVQLPANYAQTNNCYPVILLLDGSRFLLPTANAIQALRADLYPHAPEFIIVGIDSELRMRDFTPQKFVPEFASTKPELLKLYQQSGGADKFLKFISTELKPYIKNNYRSCAPSIMIGHSLAGLLAIYAWQQDVVAAAISIDPSLWFNYPQTFNKLLTANSNFKNLIFAYANNKFSPGLGNSTASSDINRQFAKQLAGHSEVLYFANANHYNVFYQAIQPAIASLLLDYYIDISAVNFNAAQATKQYARLNKKLRANFAIEQDAIANLLKKHQRSNKMQLNKPELLKIYKKPADFSE